ncbi:uncharacterized protein LAESUDRAFT_756192 [Laetiporus sulphureus 93-53]|uniref:Uncharacterized protein n=1 Tax=Laetiporus sulphureus 93-53 TaxID=1314785 RepID=A0A165G8J4_9APHY|nr:uncharacterized protein LAESUDRAFT_756192 [Laetiporus sulphureus 93-53]KZT09978.1 hypothetical protein LAESUDRAFT_756192 [Laetiporus sulphureus 93-53]
MSAPSQSVISDDGVMLVLQDLLQNILQQILRAQMIVLPWVPLMDDDAINFWWRELFELYELLEPCISRDDPGEAANLSKMMKKLKMTEKPSQVKMDTTVTYREEEDLESEILKGGEEQPVV